VANKGPSHIVVMDTREINALGRETRVYVEFNMNGEHQLKCLMEHTHIYTHIQDDFVLERTLCCIR
jgi:hypothetical protein